MADQISALLDVSASNSGLIIAGFDPAVWAMQTSADAQKLPTLPEVTR